MLGSPFQLLCLFLWFWFYGRFADTWLSDVLYISAQRRYSSGVRYNLAWCPEYFGHALAGEKEMGDLVTKYSVTMETRVDTANRLHGDLKWLFSVSLLSGLFPVQCQFLFI